AVAGIEAERIDLAAAIPVAEVARDEVAHRDRARIADGEWRLFHAAANRLPHVDHRNPVAEQPFGFLRREPVAHPLRARAVGVVVEEGSHRHPRQVAARALVRRHRSAPALQPFAAVFCRRSLSPRTEAAAGAEVTLARHEVHLDADAVRILEEDGVVSRREAAVLRRVDDARLAELVDQETMDGVDVLAAPGAKAEVVQPGTLLVESAALRARRW